MSELERLQEQVNLMYQSAKFSEYMGGPSIVAIRLRQFADRIGEILAELESKS